MLGVVRTMIRLNQRDLHITCVGNGSRDVHGERVYPFRIDAQHVDDQVGSSLRTVNRTTIPLRRKVRVVIRMCMAIRDVR